MKQALPVLFAALLSALGPTTPAEAQWSLELEGGRVWSGYNDVRIPGEGGTLFSLSRELTADAGLHARLRPGYAWGNGHRVFVLVAPLTLQARGSIDREIIFYEETFPAGTPLKATYTFNSYRLTWRRTVVSDERWQIELGATGKVRDALIRLEGGGLASTRTDLGFVPLFSFRVVWHSPAGFALLVDGDALAAPQGRAEDLLVGGSLPLTPRSTATLGYRLVEGGADVSQVYTFALIHYLSLGFKITF